MKVSPRPLRCAVGALLAAVFVWPTVADAQNPTAEFYKAHAVSIYVGLPAGGSYDSYARLIGAHLPKYLAGSPTVVVQNMPGGGSLRAANFVYNVAPQDGTIILAGASNVPFQPILDASGVKYDIKLVNWLPCPTGTVNVMAVRGASPIKNFDDMRMHEALIGTLAAGSMPTVSIGVYKNVLGAKIRAVLGYGGLPAVMLAIERGEVDGYSTIPFDTLRRVYGERWKAGALRVIAQSGDKRLPELADIPTMLELAKTADDKEIVSVINMMGMMTFPYMMGPNVPKQQVDAMRDAFTHMFDDTDFRRDAAARQMNIDPLTAEQVISIVQAAYAMPEHTLQRLKDIVALQGR